MCDTPHSQAPAAQDQSAETAAKAILKEREQQEKAAQRASIKSGSIALP